MTDRYVKCKCGGTEFKVQETSRIVKIKKTKEGFEDEHIDNLLYPTYKYFCGKCNRRLRL